MTIKANQYPKGVTIRQIIDSCGGWTKAARVLGLKPQTLIKWTIIPNAHVKAVVKMSGFPIEIVRPDLAYPTMEQFA